jgi:methyltransferase (TIGR00027 family)
VHEIAVELIMQTGQPSRTALGAARLRAAHQVLDQASILTDPLALRILGDDIEVSLDHARTHTSGPRMRWFIASRSRVAEDALTLAVNAGATQLVVLGAGLDTLAYRTQHAGRLRIFEVDHPATQARKREMLAAAAIAVPETLSFVAVDFEREKLSERLEAAGFKSAERSFFSWLGVVPYLTEAAIRRWALSRSCLAAPRWCSTMSILRHRLPPPPAVPRIRRWRHGWRPPASGFKVISTPLRYAPK